MTYVVFLPIQIRTVFVIDPKKTIRLTLAYPASTGRNFDEILRWVLKEWYKRIYWSITFSSVVDCKEFFVSAMITFLTIGAS